MSKTQIIFPQPINQSDTNSNIEPQIQIISPIVNLNLVFTSNDYKVDDYNYDTSVLRIRATEY
jgi:hypothetical protein